MGQFGDALNSAFGARDPQKMAKKCEKMKAKQQFHESKAKQLNDMLKSINPQMHHHIHTDLNKDQMEEDFTPVSTEDAKQAKLNDAMKKMKELGFEGDWVEALLKSVDCDIARAVDNLNPRMN